MARKRNPENRGLPERWRFTRNAYYYQVPPGLEARWDGKKTFKLGDTLAAAHGEWVKRVAPAAEGAKTVNVLLDRYERDVIPTHAPRTQVEKLRHLRELRKAFGVMFIEDIEPQHIYKYIDARSAKISARREVSTLSAAYTKAVEWGWLKKHPFKWEIEITSEQPRERYVEDHEIISALALPPMRHRGSVAAIQAYIGIKILTALRLGDMLRLRVSDGMEDGIHVKTHKRGKPVVYEWTDELRRYWAKALAARPVDISPFVFCNRFGESYLHPVKETTSGWNSMWQRFMDRLLAETDIKERFTEHDLRAKAASDAPTLEEARKLLAHADAKTTQKIYRRKPERVRPNSTKALQ